METARSTSAIAVRHSHGDDKSSSAHSVSKVSEFRKTAWRMFLLVELAVVALVIVHTTTLRSFFEQSFASKNMKQAQSLYEVFVSQHAADVRGLSKFL